VTSRVWRHRLAWRDRHRDVIVIDDITYRRAVCTFLSL